MTTTGAPSTGGADPVRVVAAVIERDERWLVGRRPPGKRHGGLWEFPGGKVVGDETTLDAARRELAEELAIEVSAVGPALFTAPDGDSTFVIDFVPVEAEGHPRAYEHSEIGWFTIGELDRLPLAPADREFTRWLVESRS